MSSLLPAEADARVYMVGLILVMLLAACLAWLLRRADHEIDDLGDALDAARENTRVWRHRAYISGWHPDDEPRQVRPDEHHTIVLDRRPGAR